MMLSSRRSLGTENVLSAVIVTVALDPSAFNGGVVSVYAPGAA
jgi:hypothetical protein